MTTATPTLCPPPDSYPTMEQLRQGLGEGSAIALYTCSVGVFLINIGMLAILINRFIKTVPSRQLGTFD
jgi:hypothetical protein